jgi:hypothetical protein
MELETEKLLDHLKSSIAFDEKKESWVWMKLVHPHELKELLDEVDRLKVVEEAYGAYLKAK